jgi:hypothetical protein
MNPPSLIPYSAFALDASQQKINAAEKPRALAQFFVNHYCPVG